VTANTAEPATASSPDTVAIRSLAGDSIASDLAVQIDAIFFESSGRTGFASPQERTAFRERWLGRYLNRSDVVLIAEAPAGVVAGYLVGALHDPAEQDRFTDIAYFRGDFRELCRRYPAHLHINLAPRFRSRGIGAQLIDAFARTAANAGAPGLHVVTATAARNVRFYNRCGFVEAGATCWNGRDVVFLARQSGGLARPGSP
jgi:GNAT superfamily N-acetyltransferase